MPRTKADNAKSDNREGVDERRAVTRLDPAVRREQIVVAAAAVFERHDPSEVTFEEIADAAGVSRALVYNYFGDRGGLLAAVYLHHFEAVNARLRNAAAAATVAEDRTRAIVSAYIDFATEHPQAWRLLSSRVVDHPKVREARRERMTGLAAGWGGTPEARIVANALVGLLEAATVDWIEEGDVPAPALADLLFTLLWSGFGSLNLVG